MASRSKFSTANVTITDADTWYPLPSMPVGEDCEVVIKSKGTNTGAVKVAYNSTESKAGPFLLDNPGDSLSLRIRGTEQIVVSSAVAAQVVEVIAEG